ncbi:MAG: hypothetical protein P8080_04025, partial [Gammaproteobacteria bacterium]
GTQGEVEETVADPYMGFNRGSTKLRQQWDRSVIRHIFESPLVRLMKDHDYSDAYANGTELTGSDSISWRTVWIYRYYEEVSRELGRGERPEMEQYAEGLGSFLRDIRDRICGDSPRARDAFRVYLVAHSMGGLAIRAYLVESHIPNRGRVVLIGSPNSGTPIVDDYQDTWWMGLAGPAANALGTGPESFPNMLPEPDYPVGVIAGFWVGPFGLDFIPEADDGLVPVESTKVPGMADFVAIDVSHSFMRYDDDVAKQTIAFLRDGHFIHE